METEKIDVPTFDGFECIGVAIPDKEKEELFVLNMSGTELKSSFIHSSRDSFLNSAQLCYRKIKPVRITLEFVGKNIPANKGDYYRSREGAFIIEMSRTATYKHGEVWRVVEEQS